MAKLEKDGKTISTNHAVEAVRLRAAGWRDAKPARKATEAKPVEPKPAPKKD